jgi:hypothetical protein
MSSKARSSLLKPLDGVWTPRLHSYEDDQRIFEYAPFASVFGQFLNFRRTRGNTDATLWKLLETELSKDRWVRTILLQSRYLRNISCIDGVCF